MKTFERFIQISFSLPDTQKHDSCQIVYLSVSRRVRHSRLFEATASLQNRTIAALLDLRNGIGVELAPSRLVTVSCRTLSQVQKRTCI